MPSSHLILCHPLLLLPPIPPSIRAFSNESNSSHEVARVLEFQPQHHSFQRNPRTDLLQNGLVGSPCSPRDSQECSPTPQFRSINSSALSIVHSLTLTSIHDYWKAKPKASSKGQSSTHTQQTTHTHTKLDSESGALGLDLTLLLNPLCSQISQGAHQSISKVQGW